MLIYKTMNKLSFNNFIKPRILISCKYTTAPRTVSSFRIFNKEYESDDYTNITPKILSYLDRNLHIKKNNPICLVSQRIINYFYSSFTHRGNPTFSVHNSLCPVVSTKQNFDNLLIPPEHPCAEKTVSYYINKNTLLRAHMTAHQSDLLKSGLDNFLMIGDVYRRDEIDSTHFPVFHQIDAVRSQRKDQLFADKPDLQIFEPSFDSMKFSNCIDDPAKQSCHTLEAAKLMEHQLKSHLLGMIHSLFGDDIKHRWVTAYFPFTHPSWELEIYYEDKWMEVLGCGLVRNEILINAGVHDTIAYAFGLGLDRLAMALFKIPDIRLMWSTDTGFTSQFANKDINAKITYNPVSHYPQCKNDISFWLPSDLTIDTFRYNDFYDLVREIGGDIVEQVILKDKFIHPKTKRHSLCFTIVYRSLERTLTKAEANGIHIEIGNTIREAFNVDIRL